MSSMPPCMPAQAQGHTPEAERNNRVLKERIRSSYHRLPYKAPPKKVMKVLVVESARKANFFVNKNSISQYYSPRQMVHRTPLDYNDCKHILGQYCQAHDNQQPTNTQQARTFDSLCLRPVPSGHQVYDIATDAVVTRSHVTPLPVPLHIIETI